MIRYLKYIVACCILFLCAVFVYKTPLDAATITLQLNQNSSAYVIRDGQQSPVETAGNIPYNSTVQLEFEVGNTSGNVQTVVSFQKIEGVEFATYYPGILTIDGVVATSSQYQQFTSTQGTPLLLTPQPIHITLQVVTVGSTRNQLVGALKVQAQEVTLGVRQITCNHFFYGNFSGQSPFEVQFFDQEGNILQRHSVLQNEVIDVPNLEKEGHTLLGFNTKMDGSGTYYKMEPIQQSQNYYAIFKKQTYKVRLFVKGDLYKELEVAYGDKLQVEPPSLQEDEQFIGWDKSMDAITSDMEVHALLDNIDAKYRLKFDTKSIQKNSKVDDRVNFRLSFDEKIQKGPQVDSTTGYIRILVFSNRVNGDT